MSKETLILIPGFANNELVWKHQVEEFKDSFDIHVVMMDHHFTRQEMVDDLLQNAPERFILAGHSMGGWIAQAVAAKAPLRIAKLLLLNTWGAANPQMMEMQRQLCEGLECGKIQEMMEHHLPMLIHPSRIEDIELLQCMQTMVKSFSTHILIQQLKAMLADYSSVELHPAITAPTLILFSSHDALFPQEHQILQQRIKNAQLASVDESGHASLIEQPERVTALMRSFLN